MKLEERLSLITRVESGASYESVAISAGIRADLLIKWHKVYRQKGVDGLKSLKRGKTSMKKKIQNKKTLDQMTLEEKVKYYEKKLEYLEAENEYLKKLEALVQTKKDLQR